MTKSLHEKELYSACSEMDRSFPLTPCAFGLLLVEGGVEILHPTSLVNAIHTEAYDAQGKREYRLAELQG